MAKVEFDALNIAYLFDYIAGSIRYRLRMERMDTCNNCGRADKCEYIPALRDEVRINCPHWKKSLKEMDT